MKRILKESVQKMNGRKKYKGELYSFFRSERNIGSGGNGAVYDVEFEEEMTFKIVGSTEANSLQNKISNEAPVGRALIGKSVGDVVDVETQAGIIQYKVLEIQRVS